MPGKERSDAGLGGRHESKELVESVSIFGGCEFDAGCAAKQPGSRAGLDRNSRVGRTRNDFTTPHGLEFPHFRYPCDTVRLLCTPVLLLLAAGVLAGADTVPDEHYAIYSAVLANIQSSHTDNRQI